MKDKECKDCPANSMSTEEAVSVCPCSEGYYRNTNDTNNSDEPDDGCTGMYIVMLEYSNVCGIEREVRRSC